MVIEVDNHFYRKKAMYLMPLSLRRLLQLDFYFIGERAFAYRLFFSSSITNHISSF